MLSKTLQARAEELFPGGVNSPVRAYRSVGGDPPIITQGSGSRVWDVDGMEYVDWVCAYGPLIAGHAHPKVVEAVTIMAAHGGPYGATTMAELQLAELITTRMPGIEKLRLVNSGTEAVMSALRVARAATRRELIIKFEGGYHGHADYLLAAAGSGMATFALPDSAGVPRPMAACTLVAPPGDLAALEELLLRHPKEVAAVIVEPVAANVGVIPPPAGFLEGLRQLCDKYQVLLVFDEVITGFRVAPGGAQERYRVKPDLTVLGKIIGGGLPVGAYGGRAELIDLVAPIGPVYQAGTLSGHPMVMAAGRATIELLDTAAYVRLEKLGAQLEAALSPYGRVTRVASLLTLWVEDPQAFARLHNKLRRGGVLIPPSQFEAWFISTAHTEEDIEQTKRALEK